MLSSIATAPQKQSVGETITVLSGRLNSATLLEDRRAAILGLRSFAKEYPASVASGSLRSLIGSLSRDGEDVDTVKVVLETLLMLFNPNQNSPEASDEIALWMADEFTQRQENISLLLDLLETTDFYSRLYSSQLLVAILSARTERTEECVLAATGGVSKLVALLDDQREAVRNEALTLLTFLTPSSPVIQKIVAFESAFERVFAIIKIEGSLTEGDRVIEDCLILLANLLRLNPMNQALFRESGCFQRLSELLEGTYYIGPGEQEEVALWAQEQRNRNIYALLAVIRLFLTFGAEGTLKNQVAFWQHGVLYHALQLAFSHKADVSIKAEALNACADMIKGNSTLQESFAQLQVPSVLMPPPVTNGQSANASRIDSVYVIDGLLDLILSVSTLQNFDLRLAACSCIRGYVFQHPQIRTHFLRRAIDGHTSGADETANVLTTLLQPLESSASVDPYRYWFASVIAFHLLFENPDGKALAMSLTEGDAESGEEVVTGIQTIAANLISGLAREDDERILIGYLMLLIGWLFEDLDGVNDFLGEGSNITALAEAVTRHPPRGILIQGLCAILLGVVYEFSTKDSPISRSTLHSVLASKMGRDKYIDILNRLRSQPLVREFEVIPQKLDGSGELPEVFFDATFVEFFKDHFTRLTKALDRDPSIEISVMKNGVETGVSREMVDALRSQLAEKDQALQKSQEESAVFSAKLGQQEHESQRSKEEALNELSQIKRINESVQKNHEQEMKKAQNGYEQQMKAFQKKHEQEMKAMQNDRDQTIKKLESQQGSKEEAHKRQIEAVQKEATKTIESLRTEHGKKEAELQRQLEYIRKTAEGEKDRAQRKFDTERSELKASVGKLEKSESDLKATVGRLETSANEATRLQRRTEAEMADLKATISRLEVDVMKANKAKTEEVKAVRDELSSKLSAQEEKVKEAEKQKKEVEKQMKDLKQQNQDLEKQASDGEARLGKAHKELNEKEEEKTSTQAELDDLLMVFGDLEEKVEKYKKQLKDAGQTISDDEEDDDDDDDDDEDEDDEEEGSGVD